MGQKSALEAGLDRWLAAAGVSPDDLADDGTASGGGADSWWHGTGDASGEAGSAADADMAVDGDVSDGDVSDGDVTAGGDVAGAALQGQLARWMAASGAPGDDELVDLLTRAVPARVDPGGGVGDADDADDAAGGAGDPAGGADGDGAGASDGGGAGAADGGGDGATAVSLADGEVALDVPADMPAGAPGWRPVAWIRAVWSRWQWTRRRAVAVALVGALVLSGAGWAVADQMGALPADAAFAVDGHVVTTTAFTQQLAVMEALYGVHVPSGAKALAAFRRTAAKAIAVQMVVDHAAAREGIHVAHKAAQAQLQQDVAQQYPQGFSSFVTQLGTRGLSEGEVLQAVTGEMVLQQLFNRVVGSVHPTTGQLQQLYRRHLSQLAVPETRAISHIVVATQSQAQQVLADVKAGAPFSTAAQQYSLDSSTSGSGGYLGVVSRSELIAPFAAAAFSAPVNTLFGPVHDQLGWEIGVVTQINPGHPTTFSQARAELSDYVVVTTEQQRWDRWLGRQMAASGLTFAPAYRPSRPDAPPVAKLPVLGPPSAVGSVPAPASGSAASASGAAAPSSTSGVSASGGVSSTGGSSSTSGVSSTGGSSSPSGSSPTSSSATSTGAP